MPGIYKIPMVRMTEMSDEAPECKGLKVPHSEMGVWVKAQAVRFSRNGCYETPWHVTGVSKLSGPEGTPNLRKRYGKSKQMRWIGETPLVPLAYVQFKIPMRKSRKINPYTSEGRAEIHDNLRVDVNSMLWLMRHPISTESIRYNDNRVSLYAGQDGKCAITGKKLDVQTCICYRKTNDCKKGNDSYQNLLLLSLQGLAIVSSEDMMSVVALVKEYSLNAKVITKVNKLRATAGLPLLAAK